MISEKEKKEIDELARFMDLFALASADSAEKIAIVYREFERLLRDSIHAWLEVKMEKLRLEIYRQEIQGLWLI
jgi:hypothetical protein